jgi:PAS domain S-box-containing protein
VRVIRTLASLDLTQWYYLLGIAALLAGGGLFMYRKAAVPSYRYIREKVRRAWKTIDSVEVIRKEMFPNGGTSLRDTVNKTSRLVVDVAKDVSMSIAQNRALAEEMEVGMFECDAEGSVIWANRALRKMTGLRMEQIRGGGWFNAVHDDDRRRVQNDWMLATANRTQLLALFRLTHIGTGTSLAVQFEARPVFADGGLSAGWLGEIRLRQGEAAA